MRTYRYDYTPNPATAASKGTIKGNPVGEFSVYSKTKGVMNGKKTWLSHCMAFIQKSHDRHDSRPVDGEESLRNGLIHLSVKAGTHIMLLKPYKGGDHSPYDTGVVVEVLANNRYGVHLYRLGATTAKDRYYGTPGNPTTADFSAHELVGVRKPAKFKLPVRLVEHTHHNE